VFNNPSRRTLLNEITHPEVMRRIADRLEELKETDHIVVADIPLLAEVGATEMFDLVVVVTASGAVQLDRLLRLRGMSDDQARARVAAQLPMEEKAAIADVVIVNDGSMDALVEQTEHVWRTLRSKLETKRGGRTAH
jgi:dephospho-CoA kinase